VKPVEILGVETDADLRMKLLLADLGMCRLRGVCFWPCKITSLVRRATPYTEEHIHPKGDGAGRGDFEHKIENGLQFNVLRVKCYWWQISR
jgi:hypothetical protein